MEGESQRQHFPNFITKVLVMNIIQDYISLGHVVEKGLSRPSRIGGPGIIDGNRLVFF